VKIFLFIMLSIFLCLVPSLADACGNPVYGPKLSGYQNSALELTEFADIDAISRFYGYYGHQDEGQKQSIQTAKDPNGKFDIMVTLTDDNVLDDSLSARQWQLGVDQMGDKWIVKTAGERWKCRRGKDVAKWTTKLCL
jgi:opacity protein-like surface antigen